MITKEEARRRVAARECYKTRDGDEIIIIDELTIEKPWGWVFIYNSRKAWETQDPKYGLSGNGPYLVERETGKLMQAGTSFGLETYISNYEQTGDPNANRPP